MNTASRTRSFALKGAIAAISLFAAALIGMTAQTGTAYAYQLTYENSTSTFSVTDTGSSSATTLTCTANGIFTGLGSKKYYIHNDLDNRRIEATFALTNSDGNHFWTITDSFDNTVSDMSTKLTAGPLQLAPIDDEWITVSNKSVSGSTQWPYTLTVTAKVLTPASGGSGTGGGTGTATAGTSASNPIDVKGSLEPISTGFYANAHFSATNCTGVSGSVNLYDITSNGSIVNAKATLAGKTVATWGSDSDSYRSFKRTGLKPGTKYPLTITGVIKFNGTYYKGTIPVTGNKSVTTNKLSAPSLSVTKLSKNKASIRVTVPGKETAKKLFQVRLYANGKCIKKISTTGTTTYRYTYTKAKAGSKKYTAKIVYKAATKYSKISKAKKPAANVYKWKFSRSAYAYTDMWQGFRPTKAYYKGSKLIIKGHFINSHYYSLSYMNLNFKCKVRGKIVGSKAIHVGRMAPHSTRSITFVCNRSKVADLRNGPTNWEYRITSWR